jgi:thiosulfate dehydrogenase
MRLNWKENWPLYFILLAILFMVSNKIFNSNSDQPLEKTSRTYPPDHWVAPSLFLENEPKGEERKKLIYGMDLIQNTAYYFGPAGVIAKSSNGMNCQNCHLDAGTRPWANNYAAVASTYPKFRARSGTFESVSRRVNDCFERSLNGKAIDTNSREMQSIVAYIVWLGAGVNKGESPEGSGISNLKYLDRAADPVKGETVYTQYCRSCHGEAGQGQLAPSGKFYIYPPLWGVHSYNEGAGLFRISSLAGYVKDNMPFGQAYHQSPVLSDAEAWDVAAFINSRPRPVSDLSKDWPDISKKPVDYPFGPYADGFSDTQHKFGPFSPIAKARKK